jgi:O-antigen/teichoic acid export membrane protein
VEAREASRGSAIKLAADVAGRFLSFGTTLLIARSLTVAELGRFELASIAALIAAEAADLGLLATSGRELVTGRLSMRAVLRTKLLLSAAAALVLPALVLACGLDALALPLIAYYALGGWTEWLGLVLRVRGRPVLEAVTLLIFRGTILATVALLLVRGVGIWSLALAHAIAPLAAIVVGGTLVARVVGRATAVDAGPREVLRATWPLAVNGILALISLRIEPIALGLWAGEAAVGLYTPAAKLVSFLLMVPAAVCAGAMPSMVRETARGEHVVRDRTAMTLALIAAPAAVGIALVPGVVRVFGEQYTPAAGLLRVLACAVPLAFMNALMLHALVAAGRGGRVARLTAVRVAAAVAAAAVLVPAVGLLGAAAGFALAEFALLALGHRACAAAGVPVSIARPLALGVGLSVPMAVGVSFLDVGDLAKVAAGAIVYAATLFGAKIFRSKPASPR